MNAPGQILPLPVPTINVNSIVYFDDFLAGVGENPDGLSNSTQTRGVPPGDTLDPLHPGQVWSDLTQLTTQTVTWQAANNWVRLDLYPAIEWEWLFKLTAVPANGISLCFNAGNAGGCGGLANNFGIGIKTHTSGSCLNYPSINTFYLMSEAGAGTVHVSTGEALSDKLNTWIKGRIAWNRTTGLLSAQINNSTPVTTATVPSTVYMSNLFGMGYAFLSGALASGALVLDYFKVTLTLAR